MKEIDKRFEEGISEAFNYATSVERRAAKGGSSKSSVLEQIEILKATMLGQVGHWASW